jgi:PKD repeat protein
MRYGGSRFGRARAVAALSALVLFGLAVAPGRGNADTASPNDAQAAPPWTYDANRPIAQGDLVARSQDEGIGQDEALHRFRVEDAAAVLQNDAASHWPDSFAGLWMDRQHFGVDVAFTQNAAANVNELRNRFPYPSELRALDASASLAGLTALQHRLGNDRNDLQQGRRRSDLPPAVQNTHGQYDLDIDVPSGNVVVRVAQASNDVNNGFRQAYGPRVVVSPGMAQPTTCYQYDCRYAMLGGIELDQAGGAYCSSAFSVYNGSNRWVLSAGHCYVDTKDSSRYNGGALYGYTDVYSFGGNVDAEREKKYNSSWRESSKFWVQGEDPRMVDGYITYGNMAINTYIGKSGARTQTTRGYVLSKTVAPSYVPNSYNFVSADFCVNNGDSGGAVWRSNTAWGIISGKFPNTSCGGNTGGSGAGRGIFGAIDAAKSILSVNLLMNVNLAPHASFSHSCSVLLNCSFNGGSSYDEDGSVKSWSWNFGDGTTGSGSSVSHTYSLPGSKTVTLTVTDNNGSKGSQSQTFTVL